MRFLLIAIVVLLFPSCISNKNTSYRVVNKNGKVVYFERKKPMFNDSVISNKQELENIQDINQKVKNTKEIEKLNNNKVDDNLILGSSAYTLKSVVDSVVKEEDIPYVAKKIDKNKKVKTIQDFVVPEYYFDDNVNKAKIDDRTKEEKIKQIELENKENEKEYGLFARIFGGNRNKITENITSKEDKEQLKKIELENIENEKKYGLFARIFGGNRNKTINDTAEKTDKVETKENNIKTKENNIKEEPKVGSIVINDKQQLGKSKNNKHTNKQNKMNVVYKLSGEDNNTELDNNKKYKQIDNKEIIVEKEQKDTQIQNEVDNNFTNSNYLQKNKYYIQLGSFANETKAKKLLNNFAGIGDNGRVVPIKIKDKFVYRAVIGTFNTRIIAEREMEKVLNKGHFDCYVFKKK